METYTLTQQAPKLTVKQHALWIAFLAALISMLRLALSPLFHDSQQRSLHYRIIEAVFYGIVMGFPMHFFGPLRIGSTLKLLVDEDSITSIVERRRLMTTSFRKTVHKGKIRLFKELRAKSGAPRALMLSERDEWPSRLIYGLVLVPAELPEYDSIKRLAESWRIHPATPPESN